MVKRIYIYVCVYVCVPCRISVSIGEVINAMVKVLRLVSAFPDP